MSERRKWSESDAQALIETLRAERSDQWDAYVAGEIRFHVMSHAVSGWMGVTAHRLFPDASYGEITDLLALVRSITRAQLGLED